MKTERLIVSYQELFRRGPSARVLLQALPHEVLELLGEGPGFLAELRRFLVLDDVEQCPVVHLRLLVGEGALGALSERQAQAPDIAGETVAASLDPLRLRKEERQRTEHESAITREEGWQQQPIGMQRNSNWSAGCTLTRSSAGNQ